MSVDEGRRLLLHDAAREAWGAEAALVLMEMLPPTGWGDVATRQQLEAVEDRLDTKIDTVANRLDTKIDHAVAVLTSDTSRLLAEGQRRALQWMVGTMVAMTAVFATITRLG